MNSIKLVSENINIQHYLKVFNSEKANYKHTVQQSPLWVEAYLNNYINNHGNKKPIQLTFYSEENPVGVLLLQSVKKKSTRILPKKHLEIFSKGPIDFFNLLIAKDNETDYYESITNWLFKNRMKWDEFSLSEIPETSINLEALIESIKARGFQVSTIKPSGNYFVDTTTDWDDYYNTFLKQNNKDLFKDLRKLERNGVKLNIETHVNDIYQHLSKVLHLYAQRRDALGQKNTYESEERRRFVKEVTEAYEKRGWAELSFLKDQNGNVWAFQLDWLFNGIRYHWNHAYNEDFKKYSPGKILLYYLMKRSFADPSERECNHMRGLSGYKARLANQIEYHIQIHVYNPFSVRNKLLFFYNKLSYLSPRRLLVQTNSNST